MSHATDAKVIGARLFFLPVQTRVPLKFGPETLTYVTCARAAVTLRDARGREAVGWGETPLSVQWVWPSSLPYEARHQRLKDFTVTVAKAWAGFDQTGAAFEVGHDFQQAILPKLWAAANAATHEEALPWLAALVCSSAFDLALHDAFGILHQRPVYETYGPEFLSRDLAHYLEPALANLSFKGRYPSDFLRPRRCDTLRAWHLVGGLDPLETGDLTGTEPSDGHPVVLADWIRRDGLKCLKVKLRGTDERWDYERLVRVGEIAVRHEVEWLSADFNCTVTDPAYVNEILDRLRDAHPRLYGMILYVEQPFPYELEAHPIEVGSVSARKPLFLDESAHDWRVIRRGRELGWNGVALKTCKTQTGALLSACWARAHGLGLMVQDLTNPMLAQISHCLLAANVETIMGIETNSMQFYPEASNAEARVHPGLFRRRDGQVNLASVQGPGFGYRLSEIQRALSNPVAAFER